MESTFVDGLRVTDAETLDVARMVLVGKVNRELVSALNVHGPVAVGIAGEDAGLIEAEQRDPALGFVGDVSDVNPSVLQSLLAESLIPVVSTIGSDADGQAYNINADAVAGAVAAAVDAQKLIYLTDVPGVLADVADPASLISATTVADLQAMIADGRLGGGMIPKVGACIDAVEAGVPSVHILDGRRPHALLLELFTDAGVGTMISGGPRVL
jgi:acetylglutamate kinase